MKNSPPRRTRRGPPLFEKRAVPESGILFCVNLFLPHRMTERVNPFPTMHSDSHLSPKKISRSVFAKRLFTVLCLLFSHAGLPRDSHLSPVAFCFLYSAFSRLCRALSPVHLFTCHLKKISRPVFTRRLSCFLFTAYCILFSHAGSAALCHLNSQPYIRNHLCALGIKAVKLMPAV